jgi:hypothetical protein
MDTLRNFAGPETDIPHLAVGQFPRNAKKEVDVCKKLHQAVEDSRFG